MKFAIPDSDSDDDYVAVVQDESGWLSDDSYVQEPPDLTRQPLSKLGMHIRKIFLSDSEDETSSEDDIGNGRRSHRKSKKSSVLRKPKPKYKYRPTQRWPQFEPSFADVVRDRRYDEYDKWVRETKAEAWNNGLRLMAKRQADFDQLRADALKEQELQQQQRRDSESNELMAMMQALQLRVEEEEKERTRQFEERKAKLWADIDEVIKMAERRHVEEQAALAAAEVKRKEEEAAQIVAAEKEALAKKAEAERLARQKAEKEAADRAERERAEKDAQAAQEAAQRAEAEEKAAADVTMRGRREWTKWVDIQKCMKSEVINPAKANRELRTSLKPTMRLINRWIGQVVNTQEKIIGVTNDLCAKFNEQLPSAPSAANPVVFGEQLHVPYYYLLSHTAKALVRQAVGEVAAKPEAAYPLARIVMGIMLRGHPAFGTVVFARLVKKCPWVVPYWPVRTEGQSRAEFEKSTGQLADESHDEYIRRMLGIVRLYFAVLAIPLASLARSLPTQPTPQQLVKLVPEEWRLPAAWTWVASALKAGLAKHPVVGPLLLAHIEAVGPALVKTYGPFQVGKVFAAEKAGVASGAIRCDTPATRSTITALVEEWEQKRQLPMPKGINW
ncbi:GLE1-domain-containing protein [Cutaneotrichosporon oleaginosum]|uniref:mRNA export factor GLE1 n=1 Tax=Cutaneotrichosporon oleaginosum TaxID=879819 RepID=A0A0J0XFH2_9TREE|nr:GLE1-domain-containing protein [Cutaneotrichosporon oleaginosum]KLT39798.1 GLE1-domain-containing protein [Cutaneotrichosporon oleaginosum]TXT10323.1 hypothetical protein COLE_04257 [Cutaneotrichosporon oleaginosum]